VEELQQILQLQREQAIACFLMGNGSNLLIRDGGIRGLVIVLADRFSSVIQESTVQIKAQAGVRLGALARFAWQKGLGGLEFASGIPGTLGGAVTMNAGAYGGEMQQVIESVTAINHEGELFTFNGEEMDFGYRHSRIMEEDLIVVEATLKLVPKEPQEIKAYMDDLAERRRSKQPIQYPSAGSFFKRPPGNFAGALIEQAGLKGTRVGDAQVSELHAGFIINLGEATAKDVLQLKELVQQRVFEQSGILLEPEVRIVGEEPHE
jgi:UDP-N-acetylmuramate dehydrogenase